MKACCLCILLLNAVYGYTQNVNNDAASALHKAQQTLTDIIVHDVFSPPVASRIYVYPHIAVFEILRQQNNEYPSLTVSVKGFPAIPKAPKGISYPLAAVYSFYITSKKFVFSEQRIQDSLNLVISELRKSVPDKKVFERSVAYATRVSNTVIDWAAGDNYAVTRSARRYSYKRDPGKWIPTPPAYIAAVEPHWSRIRPLVVDSATAFRTPPPIPYNTDTASHFYRQAHEVYATVRQLTTAQRDIALFWDCNPFFVNVSGHLVYATKKLSPGGHWLSIAGIVASNAEADMLTTSATYLYTAMALYDGFICCWEEKYRSNYIRPETFINANIDESWRPLLQTPPFPEYNSGHSVISAAAATVLTALWGDSVHFEDVTELAFGLPMRRFGSFHEAAGEAAISRLYGGIHFREAIENGQIQGRRIGEHLVKRLSLRPVRK